MHSNRNFILSHSKKSVKQLTVLVLLKFSLQITMIRPSKSGKLKLIDKRQSFWVVCGRTVGIWHDGDNKKKIPRGYAEVLQARIFSCSCCAICPHFRPQCFALDVFTIAVRFLLLQVAAIKTAADAGIPKGSFPEEDNDQLVAWKLLDGRQLVLRKAEYSGWAADAQSQVDYLPG